MHAGWNYSSIEFITWTFFGSLRVCPSLWSIQVGCNRYINDDTSKISWFDGSWFTHSAEKRTRDGSMSRKDEFDRVFFPELADVCRLVARRQGLSREDQEELASKLAVKLLDDDGEAMRAFNRLSSVRTYLVTIATRMVLDERNKRWGKWRPSECAKREGSTAIELERLVYRDQIPLDQAIETLLTQQTTKLTRKELYNLFERLPVRHGRYEVGTAEAETLFEEGLTVDEQVHARALEPEADRLLESLDQVRQTLSNEERMMLRLRYQEGLTVQQIAAIMNLRSKPLYKRFDRILMTLRTKIMGQGINPENVTQVLDMRVLVDFERESARRRPSTSLKGGSE